MPPVAGVAVINDVRQNENNWGQHPFSNHLRNHDTSSKLMLRTFDLTWLLLCTLTWYLWPLCSLRKYNSKLFLSLLFFFFFFLPYSHMSTQKTELFKWNEKKSLLSNSVSVVKIIFLDQVTVFWNKAVVSRWHYIDDILLLLPSITRDRAWKRLNYCLQGWD